MASTATDVLIKYTYYSDANLDGKLDGSNYCRITNAFNSRGSQLTAQIASPAAIPTAQVAASTGTSAVPKPGVLGLLGILTAPLLTRRRRAIR